MILSKIMCGLVMLGALATSSAVCPMGHTTSGLTVGDKLISDAPEGYQGWSKSDKMDYLRGKINENQHSGEPEAAAVGFVKVLLEDMSVTTDFESDEMPVPQHFYEFARAKPIHHTGFIAEVKVTWNGDNKHKYTGLFEDDLTGFIRAASSSTPDYSHDNSVDAGFAPGVAFKFLRDGVPSGNLFAVHQLEPIDSWSFFKATLTNHIPHQGAAIQFRTLASHFKTAPSEWPSFTGLSNFAHYRTDGTEVAKDELNFPFQIIFEGNPEVAALTPDEGPIEGGSFFDATLSKLEAGTTIYSIYTKDTYSAKPELMGEISISSKFTPSYWGDKKMFFQHTRYDDDLKYRPELLEGCDDEPTCLVCPKELAC